MTGLAERLAPWLSARLGADARVEGLRRHSEGFSWETYTFDAVWDGGRRGIAIRVEPSDGVLPPYDAAAQFRLQRAIGANAGVPVPEALWLETDPAVLGSPFYAMERIEGIVPVPWAGDDPHAFPDEDVRRAIGRQFVEIQARIHALDAAGAGLAAPVADPLAAAAAEVERWAEHYRSSVLTELPLVRYALGWLRANLACSGRLVLCHGDYRIGNVMVRGSRIVAIFDWELAHVGDPVEDVAYSGAPLFRGGGTRLSQLLEPEEYFALYEELTGLRVDPGLFRFWTVLGLVKQVAVYVRAAQAFEQGRADDLRLAALGHQVHYLLRHLATELEPARAA